jgi:hypothetical protein
VDERVRWVCGPCRKELKDTHRRVHDESLSRGRCQHCDFAVTYVFPVLRKQVLDRLAEIE